MDFDSSSTSSASTLRLSPFTPSLTSSPTIASSATSPLLFPEYDLNFKDCTWSSLSPPRELDPNVVLVDVRPKKKPRRSTKVDHEPQEHVLPAPAVVAIPPAQACDLPPDVPKKAPRKRTTTTTARTKSSAKRKASPAPQPVRFRFVSVQHAADAAPDVAASFEEHMEEDEADTSPFEHGPSELPPRGYPGGEYAVSPLQPPSKAGKIPASSLDFLPVLEARFARLENAIERYIELRAEKALRNSILPEPRPVPHLHPRRTQ